MCEYVYFLMLCRTRWTYCWNSLNLRSTCRLWIWSDNFIILRWRRTEIWKNHWRWVRVEGWRRCKGWGECRWWAWERCDISVWWKIVIFCWSRWLLNNGFTSTFCCLSFIQWIHQSIKWRHLIWNLKLYFNSHNKININILVIDRYDHLHFFQVRI